MLKDDDVKIFPLRAVSSKNGHICYSFIGIPEMALPKLLPAKAKELGCDPKKHFSLLKNGSSVTLDNGTVICPEMVTEEQIPANAFAVVFLPNTNYITSFIQDNQAIFDYFRHEEDGKNFKPKVVYHSMPSECVMNPLYRKDFMLKFGPDVAHILDCPETNKEEWARGKAFTLSHIIKQICPLLIQVSEQDLEDYHVQERKDMEAVIKSDADKTELIHSKIGL